MKKVVAKAGDDFPQISLDAYQENGGQAADVEGSDGNDAYKLNEVSKEPESRRYWTLSAGEGGEMWEDFYENGIAAIGWDDLGDLAKFKDKEEIRLKL